MDQEHYKLVDNTVCHWLHSMRCTINLNPLRLSSPEAQEL